MLPTAEFLSKNRTKLYYIIILGVIMSAVGLCIYYSTNQPNNDEDLFALNDAEQRNLENQTTDDSTLVFATVVKTVLISCTFI
jgi:hypothetical protein